MNTYWVSKNILLFLSTTVTLAILSGGCGALTSDESDSGQPETSEPQDSASGGASTSSVESTGGASTSGVESTGGTTAVSETTPLGTGGSGGASATTDNVDSICEGEDGTVVPYDYSFGLIGEYAYELSMSCELGGYMTPLVAADPEMLTQVDAFVVEATAWYRAKILGCTDVTSTLEIDAYGLLPVSQSSDLSGVDFDASEALFFMVIDRHDEQPDAVGKSKKAKIKDRIKSIKSHAVKNNAAELTKTSLEADCTPATSP
ncbi:MAG: hypothetical protein QM784_08910 [Polyangiaceae bacterium]